MMSQNLKRTRYKLKFNIVLLCGFSLNLILMFYFYINSFLDHDRNQRIIASSMMNFIGELNHLNFNQREKSYLTEILPSSSNQCMNVKVLPLPEYSSDYIHIDVSGNISAQKIEKALESIRFWENNVISVYAKPLGAWIVLELPRIRFPWVGTLFILLQLFAMLYVAMYLINGRYLLHAMEKMFALEDRYRLKLPTLEKGVVSHSSLYMLRKSARYIEALILKVQNLSETKMRTMAALAHDIRTPLTRMELMLYKVKDDVLKEKVFTQIDDINRILRKTIHYANQRHLNAPKVIVDLYGLVRETVKSYQEHSIERVSFIDETVNQEYMMLGAPEELTSALTNIINNALKYGKNVVISMKYLRKNILIEVMDDGIGVPEGMLGNIFLAFYQGQISSSKGNGLGLAVTKEIVEDHDGKVYAKNNSLGGLTVTMKFKIKQIRKIK